MCFNCYFFLILTLQKQLCRSDQLLEIILDRTDVWAQASETILPGIRFVNWFESLWQQMQIVPNNVNWHLEHTNWLNSQIQLMHGELKMTSTSVFYRVVNIYLAQAPSVPLDSSLRDRCIQLQLGNSLHQMSHFASHTWDVEQYFKYHR